MFSDTTLQTRLTAHSSSPEAVAIFWAPLGHTVWLGKNPASDRRFRETFAVEHEAAARGVLMPWLATPEGALSLVILLDQYPRNAFRGTPRMFATDTLARIVADAALDLGHDHAVGPDLQAFFYLPFGHSEHLADQDRSVQLLPNRAGIATSLRGSAGSRTAMRSLVVRRRPRKKAGLLPAVSRVEGGYPMHLSKHGYSSPYSIDVPGSRAADGGQADQPDGPTKVTTRRKVTAMRTSDFCFIVAGLAGLTGMILGIRMGISEDFSLASAHAHLNLLGWVTMAL